eukprot:TRINITY_DN6615_c0_g1_i1.p1 TRINITY_DN6615_c0_g1~~TRINITY_DN6615_c0_g1_i1.p1  ORF type:complete len:474 (+),score=62.99 TRINITY_DN6615_c0_g1_i1:130-1551(+)
MAVHQQQRAINSDISRTAASSVEVLLDFVAGIEMPTEDAHVSASSPLLEGQPAHVIPKGHRPRFQEVVGVSMICVTFVLVVYFLYWMRDVLIPLTFAIFFALACEPLLAAIVHAPCRIAHFLNCSFQHRMRNSRAGDGQQSAVQMGRVSDDEAAIGTASAQLAEDQTNAHFSSSTSDELSDQPVVATGSYSSCSTILQRTWSGIAVLCVVVGSLALIVMMFYGIVRVFADFDWSQYSKSPNMKWLQEQMSEAGFIRADFSFDLQKVIDRSKNYLMDTATSFLGIAESVMLCVLMFIFCLIAMLAEIQNGRQKSPVKELVQTYLVCKCVSSLLIALLVMVALWAMKVPLTEVWGIVTFVTNFIPNLGSVFAILAPVPFVWLKPGGSWVDVLSVVVVQFLVHNIAGSLIEPQIMSKGLELHPLSIVVALMFWSSVWGISGAILSLPISAALRLWMGQLDDPRRRLSEEYDASKCL